MERLISVIGEAPSELSEEAFKARLSNERDRVSRALTAFRDGTYKKTKTKKASKKAKASDLADRAKTLADKMGLTIEQLDKLMDMQSEENKN